MGLQEVQPEQVFNWLQWECMILAGAKEKVHYQFAWSDVNTSYYRYSQGYSDEYSCPGPSVNPAL